MDEKEQDEYEIRHDYCAPINVQGRSESISAHTVYKGMVKSQ